MGTMGRSETRSPFLTSRRLRSEGAASIPRIDDRMTVVTGGVWVCWASEWGE